MKKIIHYSKLVVNPENYRFDPVENQEEAIDLILEEKGSEILNLAKHILENGLDEAKDLRVLETNPEVYRVLDGNRRVTALKCLHDPSLVKNGKLNKAFQTLLKTKKHLPTNVQCFVYKEENLAAQWIKLDHTGKNEGVGQDSWGSAEKERFAYKFEGKISPAMQAVSAVEAELNKKVDTKKLKVSTINRILSNPESRSYLGVNVSGGNLIFTADKEESIARLDKLFSKVIQDNITVAKVYHTPQTIKFIRELFGDKPNTSAQPVPPSQDSVVVAKNNGKRSNPKSITRRYLIPKTCILKINETKINNIYRELRDDLLLDDTKQSVPNAVGVLFRVFLEINIDYFLEKEGRAAKPEDTINFKINSMVAIFKSKNIADEKKLKSIKKVASSRNSSTNSDLLSIENFHQYVHSYKEQPTSSALKLKWDNLQEFFEILWSYLENKNQPKGND